MAAAAPKRYLNLVFQGGGIRGIAYAGVLDKLPDYCQIKGVGGTSVGSLIAALIAIGKTQTELYAIIKDPKLRSLLDAAEVERFERFMTAFGCVAKAFDKTTGKVSVLKAAKAAWQHRRVFPDMFRVWQDAGLHSSRRLREWLDEVLADKTFGDLEKIGAVSDLKIVAADVSNRDFKVYQTKDYKPKLIADAVHASVSIPLFFTPYSDGSGGRREVDGGLLSNFPSFLFMESGYPTVGIRLEELPIASPKSTGDYLMGLLRTATDAHDKRRERPPNFCQYEIDVAVDQAGLPIPSTKFVGLTDHDVDALYLAGKKTGESIKWTECSSENPLVVVGDPKPQKTLALSMQQARTLLNRHTTQKAYWPQRLKQTVRAAFRIEADWSVRYEKDIRYELDGDGLLLVSEFASQARPAATQGQSLVDMGHTFEELDEKGDPLPNSPILIPAYHREDRRGFVVIYTPPIDATRPRRTRSTFTIPFEFRQSVGDGDEDELASTTLPRALHHVAHLTLQVLVDCRLPSLALTPDFAAASQTRLVNVGGIQYEQHDWVLEPVTVQAKIRQKVLVRRK